MVLAPLLRRTGSSRAWTGYPARTIERVWEMLAHYHGQLWNGSEIWRSFGVSHTTSRRYLDLLVDTFMIRVLPPWSGNMGKRLVKTPKVYFRDVGVLHHLLGIRTADDLARHPKVGASFEGGCDRCRDPAHPPNARGAINMEQ